MIYRLLYFGGPSDGEDCLSPRPYDEIIDVDGNRYAADQEGEACLEWAADDERVIRLHFRGRDPAAAVEVKKHRCACGGVMLPWRGHHTAEGTVLRCVKCGEKRGL